ncbi:NAD-dependent epimerase/dehydratase family protein [Loktanella sp. F6476L]|uniref:NAD-dependent epimerase/dehydratase family protein n=1 Tax=Loktanella sp. F6476L TaxID=2926405 RepID=UPI001FF46040|nr:NAD-dependent epimerase/dehydratase family protein [Loktanella sp. F6476L]MCK0122423.1 NAD-dependent epimerase/dehydratase family protein [Loktanella sp. F6476L]
MLTILGGSGFIGTNLCRSLAAQNIDFRIVDLKPSPEFADRTLIADIRDKEGLLVTLASIGNAGPLINLAAVHRDDVSDRQEYYNTNVDGIANICDIATELGIDRIVFTSTVAVYGFAAPQTDETGTIDPFNDYGRSKFEGEKVLNKWFAEAPKTRTICIVRPTVVFGEGNRGNVFNLLNQIASGRFVMIGDGKNKKSLAYVGNIVAFLEWCTIHPNGSDIFNYVDKPDFDMNSLVSHVRSVLVGIDKIGFRLPYPVGMFLGKIADGLAKVSGKNLPISSIRVKKFCSETSFSSSAHDQDGFVAPYKLDEGLRRTLVSEFLEPDDSRTIFYTE